MVFLLSRLRSGGHGLFSMSTTNHPLIPNHYIGQHPKSISSKSINMASSGQPTGSGGNQGVPSSQRSGSSSSDEESGEATPSQVQQQPQLPVYMPALLIVAGTVLSWIDELLVFTAMDLMATSYALVMNNQVADAREIWQFLTARMPQNLVDRALQGYATFRIAVQNGGVTGSIAAPVPGNLNLDAATHLSWAWRRLLHLGRDTDSDEVDRLGQRIFGARWREQTAARAQSEGAE